MGFCQKYACSKPSLLPIYSSLSSFDSLPTPRPRLTSSGILIFLQFAACFLRGLIFRPENGGSTFLRNVCKFLPDFKSLHIRVSGGVVQGCPLLFLLSILFEYSSPSSPNYDSHHPQISSLFLKQLYAHYLSMY